MESFFLVLVRVTIAQIREVILFWRNMHIISSDRIAEWYIWLSAQRNLEERIHELHRDRVKERQKVETLAAQLARVRVNNERGVRESYPAHPFRHIVRTFDVSTSAMCICCHCECMIPLPIADLGVCRQSIAQLIRTSVTAHGRRVCICRIDNRPAFSRITTSSGRMTLPNPHLTHLCMPHLCMEENPY